jgi:predicted dehydrogenase
MGIVGSGYMGRTYAQCVAKHNEGVELVAVSKGSRAPRLASDYGIDHIPDYTAMLERDDIDAVLLATPHHLHAEETIAAAQHGKHVLVEKPMMTNVADCDAMIAACKKANVKLSVIHTGRYRGVFKRAKDLIDEGLIGRVRMINLTTLWVGQQWRTAETRPDQEDKPWLRPKPWTEEVTSGGDISDRCSHSFDYLRFLTGEEAVTVFATVGSFTAAAWRAKSAMMQIHFSGCASAQVWMSHEIAAPGFPNSGDFVRVSGDKGLIEAHMYGKLRVATYGEWRDVWEMPELDFAERFFDPARLEAFYMQTQDFVDSLREDRPPAVTGEDGRAAIEMIEAAYLSSLTGNSVRLPLPRSKGGFQFDGATVPRDLIPG